MVANTCILCVPNIIHLKNESFIQKNIAFEIFYVKFRFMIQTEHKLCIDQFNLIRHKLEKMSWNVSIDQKKCLILVCSVAIIPNETNNLSLLFLSRREILGSLEVYIFIDFLLINRQEEYDCQFFSCVFTTQYTTTSMYLTRKL